jgi:phage baseplate assembly protein W
MATQTLYSDFDISFLPDPITADLMKVENEESIKQSLRLLVLTSVGERLFQPGLGGTVNRMLFEPLDKVTTTVLVKNIGDTIRQFERRVELQHIDVYFDKKPTGEYLDANTLWIEIAVKVLNLPNLITTGVLLRRLR